jgi:hypothetical protein
VTLQTSGPAKTLSPFVPSTRERDGQAEIRLADTDLDIEMDNLFWWTDILNKVRAAKSQ